jgi:Adenosine specific kinase
VPSTSVSANSRRSCAKKFPEDKNIIVGQTHFIKTAEDMYEAVVNAVPQAKFGLAFNESSGPRLTRAEAMMTNCGISLSPMRKRWVPVTYSFSSCAMHTQ